MSGERGEPRLPRTVEREREEHDVAAHAVEPRKGEEPLVDQVPVRGKAVDRDDRRSWLVTPMTKHARVRDPVGAVPQVRFVLSWIDGLERTVESASHVPSSGSAGANAPSLRAKRAESRRSAPGRPIQRCRRAPCRASPCGGLKPLEIIEAAAVRTVSKLAVAPSGRAQPRMAVPREAEDVPIGTPHQISITRHSPGFFACFVYGARAHPGHDGGIVRLEWQCP